MEEREFEVQEPAQVYGINNLLYKDEVYDIIACCFEVHKTLGPGFLEVVYKDALEIEFKLRSLPFEREKIFPIHYKSFKLNRNYTVDFFVYDKIVLECKAQYGIIGENYKQSINYLATSGSKLALLVNFGEPSLKFKRVIL
jgi:GxxExxY protein